MTAMLNIAVNTDVTAQLSRVEQSRAEQSRAEHIIVGNTDVTAQLSRAYDSWEYRRNCTAQQSI